MFTLFGVNVHDIYKKFHVKGALQLKKWGSGGPFDIKLADYLKTMIYTTESFGGCQKLPKNVTLNP